SRSCARAAMSARQLPVGASTSRSANNRSTIAPNKDCLSLTCQHKAETVTWNSLATRRIETSAMPWAANSCRPIRPSSAREIVDIATHTTANPLQYWASQESNDVARFVDHAQVQLS